MPSPAQRLIGLYSASPGCGKSTVARFLTARGCERISFADPLRSMVCSLLLDLGYDSGQAHDWLHDRKEQILPELGVSPRHLLRTLGTEWGRDCVHPTLWLLIWHARISGYSKVVVDDVRFPNEAESLRQRGGVLWRIDRPDHQRAAEHRSDDALADWTFDRVIVNDGTLAELASQAEAAYHELSQKAVLLAA